MKWMRALVTSATSVSGDRGLRTGSPSASVVRIDGCGFVWPPPASSSSEIVPLWKKNNLLKQKHVIVIDKNYSFNIPLMFCLSLWSWAVKSISLLNYNLLGFVVVVWLSTNLFEIVLRVKKIESTKNITWSLRLRVSLFLCKKLSSSSVFSVKLWCKMGSVGNERPKFI